MIVVVDDKLAMAETLADGLDDRGLAATAAGSGRVALELVARGDVELVITDLRMPEPDGLALVDQLHADIPVIVMTAYGAIDSAVESIRRGAYHYLTKPFGLDELEIFVRRALADRALRREAADLRAAVRGRFSLAGIVAESAAMQRAVELVHRVAASDVSVLLSGETGTGKGRLARAIHGASARAAKPFVALDCAALPEPLLESELFGHVKGAFTGATADHAGLFASADGGTLLLDEIGELPLGLQAKLLRVLEDRTIRAVGATRERTVDVRVLAATHRDLRRASARDEFRADLLYRLDVVNLEVPPLRHRREDIAPLAAQFLADALARHPHAPARTLAPAAVRALLDHAWPGNVRELAHAVERGVVLAAGAEISVAELAIAAASPAPSGPFAGPVAPMRELQRRYARWALEQEGGHKTRTAERLDVDVKTLNRWLADDD